MKAAAFVLSLLVACFLVACGVRADRFPGAAVAPPVELAGQWQLVLGGETSTFDLAPAARNHYRVTQPGREDVMDASVQAWQGAHYLVVTDAVKPDGVSVFKVLDAGPGSLRIAALDPAKTEAVLTQRGMPVIRKKMWLYQEIALTGPALEAVLALPAADVFALGEDLTFNRVQ